MRSFQPQIPSFTNRLASALLYPETNRAMRAKFGKHWIVRPRWQPGAKEHQRQDYLRSQALAREVMRNLRG